MKLLNDFIAEMDRGLSGEESSIKMIPSYVTQLAAGDEAGHVRVSNTAMVSRVVNLSLPLCHSSSQWILVDPTCEWCPLSWMAGAAPPQRS
jgi:Hexokinase